jgi:hypothetical protein
MATDIEAMASDLWVMEERQPFLLIDWMRLINCRGGKTADVDEFYNCTR